MITCENPDLTLQAPSNQFDCPASLPATSRRIREKIGSPPAYSLFRFASLAKALPEFLHIYPPPVQKGDTSCAECERPAAVAQKRAQMGLVKTSDNVNNSGDSIEFDKVA